MFDSYKTKTIEKKINLKSFCLVMLMLLLETGDTTKSKKKTIKSRQYLSSNQRLKLFDLENRIKINQ